MKNINMFARCSQNIILIIEMYQIMYKHFTKAI